MRERTPGATARRRGVVMIDVLMSIVIIGIALMAILPTLHPDKPMRVVAATTILAADLEAAQSLTLTNPGDPTIVRFADDGTGYWLALASEPDTPITKQPSGDPFRVTFGQGDHKSLEGVTLEVVDLAGTALEYSALGRLVQSEDAWVRIEGENDDLGVRIRAATGSVSIVASSEIPEPPAPIGPIGPAPGGGGTFIPGGSGNPFPFP
jgi:hypothetical protein